LSLSSGSLSAAVGTGGGATGASFLAASVSGRPSSGEPGGRGWGVAAGAAGVCWACAPGNALTATAAAAQKLETTRILRISASLNLRPLLGHVGRRRRPTLFA